jgi:uncharacterized membrane protein YoaK (UPF0700 family)
MSRFLAEIRETLVPDREGRHGPLPVLMVAMTFVTGLVDAFSFLVLGHVFVANMTGNVVFLGFAFAGAQGFSIPASSLAIAFFGLGALLGGTIGARLSQHRGRLLSTSATIQAVLLAASVLLAAFGANPISSADRYALIAVLSAAMGIQNATARRLAVPDLTTTVLTLTITGIASDSTLAGGAGAMAGRRVIAVITMLAGAFIGAALVIHVHRVVPLVIALLLIAIVAATARVLGTSDPPWVKS